MEAAGFTRFIVSRLSFRSLSMPIFDNYAPVVIQALQTRGLSGDCPMCKKNQWVVHEVPTSIPVYETNGQVKIPGTSMPMAVMICRNCGFASFHSLGALGLINQNQGGQAGQASPMQQSSDAPISTTSLPQT
jgi:hypothetical protein